jgi:type I restriction enzyme, S subunit
MKQGWELKTLKDIGVIFSGNSINAKIKEDRYSDLSDGLSYVATKDIGYDSVINYENGVKIPYDEVDSFKVAPKNSVLICAEGGSAGRKIGRITQDVCFVNKLFAITPDNEATSKYVYYWYKSVKFKKEFNSRLTGLIGGVSKKKFEKIPIPLAPLPELKQIVDKLDEAFTAIDSAKFNVEKNLENAKELFQSKLNEIFNQKGEGWVDKKLGEIGTLTSSKRIYKKEYVSDGVPFYRSKEIKELAHNNDISLELFITKERYEEISSQFGIPEEGDILLTAVGTIGEMYVVKSNERFYFKDGNIMWLKDFSTLNSYYLKYALTFFVEQLKSMSQGSAYSALTIEKLKEYSIPVPSISKQELIVKELDTLRDQSKSLESKYQQEFESLEELKKSILEKAFNGEL